MTGLAMSVEQVLVSVVLPVFNGQAYVAEAIASVLAQRHARLELIVVDDGSSDRSAAVVQRFLTDSRVQFVPRTNGGVAAARNTALRLARGGWVAFIDQDDVWLPDKLGRQLEAVARQPGAGLVYSAYECIDAGGAVLGPPNQGVWRADVSGRCIRDLFIRNRIGLLTAMVRRDLLGGGFNEALSRADDYELWLRVSWISDVVHVPAVLARYRMHDSNASHDTLKMELAELGAVDAFLAAYPQARRAIGAAVVNQRVHELCRDIGNSLLTAHRDDAGARRHFLRALRCQPGHGALWRKLLRTAVPRAWRQRSAWYQHRVRAWLSSGRGSP